MKVLTVDDSSVVRKIIRAATDSLQLELMEAEDGLEALMVLNDNFLEIDLVLLDWNMPAMSGFEVLVEMKRNDNYKKIPVMMVTTEGERENIVAAVKAGAINYLVKPFTMEDLIVKIIECVGESEII